MAEAPNPAIFVNEDVSKPENRLNLALLGLMNVPRFREWIIQRLSLPKDSVFYPPQNSTANLRPDLVVTSSTTEKVYGWVEVELGSENSAQIKDYRDSFEERVISIVGQGSDGDLSLKEIAGELVEWLPELNAQQRISADIVITLIDQKAGRGAAYDYIDPEPQIKNLPIMRMFEQYLGDILRFGTPPVPPGKVLITTITQKGWTLRVFAPGALGRSVSLMWDQSLGRGVIRVPSAERLLRCLPEAGRAISDFNERMQKLGFDLEKIKSPQSVAVPEQTILATIDDLAPPIRRLATANGAGLGAKM